MLVGELPRWYKTIFIFILIFEDVLHHHFIMRVVRWVSMLLKFLLQVLFYLKCWRKWYISCFNDTETRKEVHFTSCLESFQSSLRSMSRKESCDLGPFLISINSMSKIKVLLGGILPVLKNINICKNMLQCIYLCLFLLHILPFPSLPYARDGGMVNFLRSPVHIFCRPLSQPLMASRIPRVNHTGFLSPSLRLNMRKKEIQLKLLQRAQRRKTNPCIQ